MTRRSWRDLRPGPARGTAAGAATAGPRTGPPGDLDRAARLAPDTRLADLVAQRRALEDRLRGLTGQGSGAAAVAARFPVASFAERQQAERAWEARRAAMARQQEAPAAIGAVRPEPSRTGGMPDRRFDPLPPAATGLTDRVPRSGLGARLAQVRSAIGAPRRAAQDGLSRVRSVTEPAARAARPVRDLAERVGSAREQVRDLDRQLAAEGVDDADRAEIRRSLGGDTLDKVGGPLSRAASALEAPRRAADRIGRDWARRERQITAPMDRVSSYVDRRDRRLSTESGGSGDVFERLMENRRRALERRRAEALQDQRDQQRRDRASARRRERDREDQRDEA